ncbi:MAG: UDP-N-acetylglucosamine 2-epimerase (non-hydrolyzing) [Verrucomicrobiales bacterium]|nr:UDP-N-acetylglucosamine 2-epimerase (non-hydrolyzing) [Verrucomicrobiales bacterium]
MIKFAPVIRYLEAAGFETINISTAQHRDLIRPLIEHFELRIDHDLDVMKPGQTLNGTASRVLEKLDPILADTKPNVVLVQGDTTTAMTGALAAWNRQIPVGHIEAGLRTDSPENPFPEEMNRRLITRMAKFHFASTERNRMTLISEKVDLDGIFVTGNPVIDALEWTLAKNGNSEIAGGLFEKIGNRRLIVLTTHRRESFGEAMGGNLDVIADFVRKNEDVAVVFPVHPNPAVVEVANEKLGDIDRIHLIEPMDYPDFLQLLARAWVLVSDSGGLQEEAPSLGKPLLILRENTERPEAVDCGAARLIGGSPEALRVELEEIHRSDRWTRTVESLANPFGDGQAAEKIARALLVHAPLTLSA